MEQEPEPIGSPPAYSEIVKYDSSADTTRGHDVDEQVNPKLSQYTWADPTSSQCPPAGPSQYPSVPAGPGPGPYVPAAYGHPIYYQQSGYGTPYYQHQQQQVTRLSQ